MNTEKYKRKHVAVLYAEWRGYSRLMSEISEQEYSSGHNDDLP